MVEAVLWDNDGVLVDSETLFFETTRAAFARLHLDLTPELWGKHYLGEGKKSREVAALLGAPSDRIARMLKERDRDYLLRLRQAPPLQLPAQRRPAGLQRRRRRSARHWVSTA